VATHDLPPLAGWWQGADIDERLSLGLIGADEAVEARTQRAADRAALIQALADEDLLTAPAQAADGPLSVDLAASIHAFIAKTPALLAIAQVEDLAGEVQAVNLPGTDRERPNWRRRIAVPLEELFSRPEARAILEAMRRAKPAEAAS
jgi:glycogen operon protein